MWIDREYNGGRLSFSPPSSPWGTSHIVNPISSLAFYEGSNVYVLSAVHRGVIDIPDALQTKLTTTRRQD
jgi:hypothetical protein